MNMCSIKFVIFGSSLRRGVTIILNQEELEFVNHVKFIYKHQRRKKIDEVVQDVLIRLGRTSICSKDKDLIRICYALSPHYFSINQNRIEGDTIKMRQCIYTALKKSPLFKNEKNKEVVFYLSPKGFKCNNREKGYCPVINNFCEQCDPIECAYYIKRHHHLNSDDAKTIAKIGHISANADWMDAVIRCNTKRKI